MKFMHLSDLHIGKRVNEFSMIEDQIYILQKILELADKEKPDAILIAGDVYDKNLPTIDGVNLLDDFLSGLHERKIPVFMISGNHDSADRLNFASRILRNNDVYIAGTYQGEIARFTIKDGQGPVNIYLLPFVKPAIASVYHEGVESYHDAVKAILSAANVKKAERNILVAHQFVTAGDISPECCDSENISVGWLDNVDVSVFDDFDYVALGHLHGPQRIGRDTVRYAGSPLKYSFSETNQKKSVTMVTINNKEEIIQEYIPLIPLRDMRQLKGPIDELLNPKNYKNGNTMDYIHATLTDEEEIYDAIGRIRSIYPNVMRIDFDNSKTKPNETAKLAAEDIIRKDPLWLFEEFFKNQNNVPMSDEQHEIMKKLLMEQE